MHHRNRLTRRTTIPFASTDIYGPKQVFKKKIWVLKSFQNFFRALKDCTLLLLKSIFWRSSRDYLVYFLNTLEWLSKITTSWRLRPPKLFQASYEHAVVLVRKLTTCTTLYKQTKWSRDTLNVWRWQFCSNHDFQNHRKINIFT